MLFVLCNISYNCNFKAERIQRMATDINGGKKVGIKNKKTVVKQER